jgi:ATP-dependent Clp protease ATP-binding subunit ClpA
MREAVALGHNYIGTEHIILALARENEGVANRILDQYGASSQEIRNAVLRMLSGSSLSAGRPQMTGRLLMGVVLFTVGFGLGLSIGRLWK